VPRGWNSRSGQISLPWATTGRGGDAFREGAPAAVHTDGGKEFDNRDARAYLREREVLYRVGPPHTPKAQAFVERFVRTLKEE